MQSLKEWIIAALVVIAFLVICAIDDGHEEKQRAADDVKVAQTQARLDAAQAQRDLKARAAYAGHLLALDRMK